MMNLLSRTLTLGELYLTAPSEGAEASRERNNLWPSVALYATFLAASLLFYWFKPWDFPETTAPVPLVAQDIYFWLKVLLWQPPLELAWIAFLLGFVVWFREGNLSLRLTGGVVWVLLVFFLLYYHAANAAFPNWAFGGLSALSAAPFYFLLKRSSREDWLPLTSLMLGLNVIGIVLLAPMIVSVFVGSPFLFETAQVVGGLWMLAAATIGVRVLTGLRLPRAFMAILLATILQMFLVIALYFMGAASKDILKAILYF